LLDTSAGFLLHNENSKKLRMMVANHGWDDKNLEVVQGEIPIGVIKERMPGQDWGFVELNKDVVFVNEDYFHGPVPHSLVASGDVSKHAQPSSFFGAYGFTTGLVGFAFAGLAVHTGKGRVQRMSSGIAYLMRKLRGTQDEVSRIPAGGLCGAPVVHQEGRRNSILSNKVCGFVWLSNLQISWIVAVDPLIDEGWEIAKS
jgi:hypothetical protein